MRPYRVLVAHRDLRLKQVALFEPSEQVRFLVEAGYLAEMDEVADVAGTEIPGVVEVKPKRRKKVTDVEGGAEPDGGPDVRVP